jgi:hypothetical protein
MSNEPSEQQWMDIQQELFAGRKIQAIKLYRQAAGVDLKNAKDAMDAYERKLREQAPDRFTAPPAKAGCVSVILLFVGILAFGCGMWEALRT